MADPRVRKLRPDEVQKLLDAAKTPRMRELETLQAFFEGTQYAGRKDFYDDSVPVQERAPCVVYRLVSVAAESNVAFAMGEGRFPAVISFSAEDDTLDDDLALDENASKVVDAFNAKLVDLARLEQVFRNAYRMAQAARSVAIVLGFRAGLPFADLIWPKLCTPTFGDELDPSRVTKLEVRFRYTEPWRDALVTGGEWWTRVYEYLRVIDDKADTVYEPVAIWEVTDAGAVEGSTKVRQQTKHGFGLCPVHWYARQRDCAVSTNVDGKAIHDGSCRLLEQLDMALSQRHRAAVYAGDPQTVLTGVSAEETVGPGGRSLKRPALMPGDDQGPAKQWQGALYYGQDAGGSLRRGVGQLWRLEAPEAKALMLTLPGDALTSLDEDAKDLASKACDALGVTLVDPAAFKGGGDLSGRTLSFIFSKQINRVSQDREDVGRCCILPVLNLFYRMLLTKPDGVYLPGLAKVVPILKKFSRPIQGSTKAIWFSPQLKLKWGDYFEPSDVDEATRVTTAQTALTAGIILKKTAVEHVKGIFAIQNVDEYVDNLEEEAQKNQADLHAAMAALGPGNAAKPAVAKPAMAKPAAAKPAKAPSARPAGS